MKILNYLFSEDLSSALKLLNEEINKGSSFNSIMNEFRKTCVKLIHYKYGLETKQSEISKMASMLDITTIKRISEIINTENIINIENFRLNLEILLIELFELFQVSPNKNINTLPEKKNNDLKENTKTTLNPNNSMETKAGNVSPQNNSIDATTDLMKFIQVFENKNWYWKIKAVKNYKVHENLLNLYFDHQSQIDMLKVEINKPESIQLAKSAIVSIWGKELLLNLKLTNNNEETENKSNEIDNKALFLSEASKYGKLISLKEIKNES